MAVLCILLLEFIGRKKSECWESLKRLWLKITLSLFSALLSSREGCEASENLTHVNFNKIEVLLDS